MSASPHPPSALVAGLASSEVRTVRDVLTRLGVGRIDAVPDGKAAISVLGRQSPSLLVVAWDDPATPPEEVLAAARKGREEGPKVIVAMAAPTRKSVDEAIALNVDSIVATPFSPKVFLDRVPRLVLSPQENATA